MLTLKQICSIYATDKNSYHSYVDNIYEDLFKEIRHSAKQILEIGVDNGGSILMWRDYFSQATINGIDEKDCPQLLNRERVHFLKANAYSNEVVDKLSNFDVIIDDGPHTLESMVFIIKEYTKKINEKGIIVIEDIQDFNWTNILKQYVPNNFNIEIKDIRKFRNRYDDIAIILTKF